MANRTTGTQLSTHDLNRSLMEQEAMKFATDLSAPIIKADLDGWIGESKTRGLLFAHKLHGTIRWKKTLGRPLVARLASAFVIEHSHWDSVMEYVPGGVRYIDILFPHDEPSKRDGPEDDQYYRVSFMADTPERPTRIRVRFAANVGWELLRAGYRDIQPTERSFTKGEGPTVLDPFEVVTFERVPDGDSKIPAIL